MQIHLQSFTFNKKHTFWFPHSYFYLFIYSYFSHKVTTSFVIAYGSFFSCWGKSSQTGRSTPYGSSAELLCGTNWLFQAIYSCAAATKQAKKTAQVCLGI